MPACKFRGKTRKVIVVRGFREVVARKVFASGRPCRLRYESSGKVNSTLFSGACVWEDWEDICLYWSKFPGISRKFMLKADVLLLGCHKDVAPRMFSCQISGAHPSPTPLEDFLARLLILNNVPRDAVNVAVKLYLSVGVRGKVRFRWCCQSGCHVNFHTVQSLIHCQYFQKLAITFQPWLFKLSLIIGGVLSQQRHISPKERKPWLLEASQIGVVPGRIPAPKYNYIEGKVHEESCL